MLEEMLGKAKNKFAEALKKQNELVELAAAEKRDLLEAEIKGFDSAQLEIDNALVEIERLEKLLMSNEKAKEPAKVHDIPAVFGTQKEKKDDGGFKSVGEFIHSVRFGDDSGRLDELKKDLATDDFGFMMPPELYGRILELSTDGAIVRPRAMVLPAGTPPDGSITIPSVDQSNGNMFGGVEVAWIDEGEFKPETTFALKSITVTPYELAASIRVTDKALRNFTALSPLLTRNLGGAMNNEQERTFFLGHGDESLSAGQKKQPLGFLNSPALVKVGRKTAGTVTYADIVNLEAQMLPSSITSAVWILDRTLFPVIRLLKDDSGSYIFGPGDVSLSRPDTLNGRVITWTDKTASGGVAPTMGDIGLYDLGYYIIKDGFGPVIQASQHPFFQNNVTVIKAFTNVGGMPWLTAPITLENGLVVSPFVALDAPTP